jgi:hypothetical protein
VKPHRRHDDDFLTVLLEVLAHPGAGAACLRHAGRSRFKTMITLGDMADKGMRMLEVACRRCERRGRLSIARLIAEP